MKLECRNCHRKYNSVIGYGFNTCSMECSHQIHDLRVKNNAYDEMLKSNELEKLGFTDDKAASM